MYKKQIAVIVIVVAIMGYVYSLPVKGLIKPEQSDGHTSAAAQQQTTRQIASVTLEMVSSAGKIAIGPAMADQVSSLEKQLTGTTGNQQLMAEKKLAGEWEALNQPAPAAFYYRSVAEKEGTFNDWLTAGNRFNDAFKFDQDTVSQPAFVSDAIACFKKATQLQPANLEAKTGLGVAYVNQTSLGMTDPDGGSPMQGIMLLLDVVKQDPNNYNANLDLGEFAMNSRQYDKAVQRLKTVIAQKPGYEPYFYLAESYKQLGMKKEAIDAYQKSRDMMPDSAFDRRIDEYIKELKQ
jgi:tetratricopeptide (TPR) repeat protein